VTLTFNISRSSKMKSMAMSIMSVESNIVTVAVCIFHVKNYDLHFSALKVI